MTPCHHQWRATSTVDVTSAHRSPSQSPSTKLRSVWINLPRAKVFLLLFWGICYANKFCSENIFLLLTFDFSLSVELAFIRHPFQMKTETPQTLFERRLANQTETATSPVLNSMWYECTQTMRGERPESLRLRSHRASWTHAARHKLRCQ